MVFCDFVFYIFYTKQNSFYKITCIKTLEDTHQVQIILYHMRLQGRKWNRFLLLSLPANHVSADGRKWRRYSFTKPKMVKHSLPLGEWYDSSMPHVVRIMWWMSNLYCSYLSLNEDRRSTSLPKLFLKIFGLYDWLLYKFMVYNRVLIKWPCNNLLGQC